MAKPPFHVRMSRAPGGDYRDLWSQGRKDMDNVLNNLRKFISWVTTEVTPEAMQHALEPTLELSNHYAPKDTYAMVNSGYNSIVKRGGQARAEVGYNRYGEAPYTVFVHEMPQFFHEPPTQYKFLQRAMDEDTPEIAGRVAAYIRSKAGT